MHIIFSRLYSVLLTCRNIKRKTKIPVCKTDMSPQVRTTRYYEYNQYNNAQLICNSCMINNAGV